MKLLAIKISNKMLKKFLMTLCDKRWVVSHWLGNCSRSCWLDIARYCVLDFSNSAWVFDEVAKENFVCWHIFDTEAIESSILLLFRLTLGIYCIICGIFWKYYIMITKLTTQNREDPIICNCIGPICNWSKMLIHPNSWK